MYIMYACIFYDSLWYDLKGKVHRKNKFVSIEAE